MSQESLYENEWINKWMHERTKFVLKQWPYSIIQYQVITLVIQKRLRLCRYFWLSRLWIPGGRSKWNQIQQKFILDFRIGLLLHTTNCMICRKCFQPSHWFGGSHWGIMLVVDVIGINITNRSICSGQADYFYMSK